MVPVGELEVEVRISTGALLEVERGHITPESEGVCYCPSGEYFFKY